MGRLQLTPHGGGIGDQERAARLGQRGAVVWLTGLSGAGKSTIAYAVERALLTAGKLAFVLDGDDVRRGLCADLGFSPADRAEHIRRVAAVAALFADAGVITLAAFISPYRAGRQRARATIGAERFIEVYLDTPLAVCEGRDPKGLYRLARAGELAAFTGISAPYEPPTRPALRLDTAHLDVATCTARVVAQLDRLGALGGAAPPGRQPS